MAVPVKAEDLGFYVDGDLVGCAQSAEMTISREMLEAVCAASGNWREVTPGMMSWEGSLDALWRNFTTAEMATNVDARHLFDYLVAGNQVEVRLGHISGLTSAQTTALNGFQLVGMCYFSELALNYDPTDTQSWTGSFTGTGPLTRVAPTPAA